MTQQFAAMIDQCDIILSNGGTSISLGETDFYRKYNHESFIHHISIALWTIAFEAG